MPIGTVSKGRKKVAEGKWVAVKENNGNYIKAGVKNIKIPDEIKNKTIHDFYSEKQIQTLNNTFWEGVELFKKYKEKYKNLSHLSEKKRLEIIIAQESYSSDYNFDMSNARWQFFEQGFNNASRGWDDETIQKRKPEFKIGWRYGKVPDGGQSYNYRDEIREPGVSIMQILGGKKLEGSYEMFNYNPVISWVAGFDIDKRGADGEHLFVAPKLIKEQKI
jgi:hypothetical protein